MRTLLLLRHAKSSWDDPTFDDHERPLSPRGRRAAAALARHVERAGLAPDLVLCSSARRARQTLGLLLDGLAGEATILVEDGLYAAEAAELLERLREVDDADATVLVIGHNPGIQELAVYLAATGAPLPRVAERLVTGALAELELAVDHWTELAEGCGHLASLVLPRELD
ncbi:MAG: histidine phosphatase family protein [Thermoleophilia bacterium]